MILFPAIDILDCKAVRLTEGIYGSEKVYGNPLEIAEKFHKNEIKHMHLVDLNGAKSGETPNAKTIQEITKNFPEIFIQVGGGIRSIKVAEQYFNAGVDRIIVGSAAIKNPEFLKNLLENFGPEKIVLGVDVKAIGAKNISPQKNHFQIYTSGWTENSKISAEDFLGNTNAENILMTDISRDGKLQGPNTEMYQQFIQKFPEKKFIGSGGVSDIQDLENLQKIGCHSAIIGKAFYENRITLDQIKNF